ncbi:hypothetical protein FRB93_009150 [Tulasnella sp. JGI-2019a]|nr:hypothetical protein FRB93_009150 [Tulasnella sp. JGI-2019a]
MGIFSTNRFDDLLKEHNDEEWIKFRDRIVTRVNNINVIGTMFTTAAAVFLSTTSPNPSLASWSNYVCFITFGGAIGTAIMATVVGCIITYTFTDLRAVDLRKERFRWLKTVFVVGVLLAHTALIIAALILIQISFVAAVWHGTSLLAKAGAAFAVAVVLYALAVAGIFGLLVSMGEES